MSLLVTSTVACGPRISQWVQVVDCSQKHVVVPDAHVLIYRDASNAGKVPLGRGPAGGKTDASGNTWSSFSVEKPSAIQAFRKNPVVHMDTPGGPITEVPANPTEYIYACAK